MPHIKKKDLLNLYKEIDFQKEKTTKIQEYFKGKNKENESLKKHRLIFGIISGLLALILMLGAGVYLFSPSVFMSTSKFEKEGYKIISTEEYSQMKEVSDAQNAKSLVEDTDSESDYYEDQESIDGTVIYSVQIAAFENKGIQLYSDNLIQFIEVRKDEFYKYSLGAFETLEEAQSFRKEIVDLGLFKDSFVASYKNGRRLRIEDPF